MQYSKKKNELKNTATTFISLRIKNIIIIIKEF